MNDEYDAQMQEEYSQTCVPALVTTSVRSPFDADPVTFERAMTGRAKNHDLLMRLIAERLVDGVDYGKIHIVSSGKCPQRGNCNIASHWTKPSLFKSGAEKICVLLGLSPHYPQMAEYERKIMEGWAPEVIVLRCELVDACGHAHGEGVGSRKPSQDYGDLNKALKMAEKSSQIDATIRTAGISSRFTQDAEDMSPSDLAEPEDQRPSTPVNGSLDVKITPKQHLRMETRIAALQLDREKVKSWVKRKWNIDHFTDLKPIQYNDLDKRLEGFAEAERKKLGATPEERAKRSRENQAKQLSSQPAPAGDEKPASPAGRSSGSRATEAK